MQGSVIKCGFRAVTTGDWWQAPHHLEFAIAWLFLYPPKLRGHIGVGFVTSSGLQDGRMGGLRRCLEAVGTEH